MKCRFEDIRSLDGGLAPARIGGEAGFINPDGSWIIEPRFEKTFEFDGELAVVQIDRKWSYIDRAGGIVWTSEEGAQALYPPAPLIY